MPPPTGSARPLRVVALLASLSASSVAPGAAPLAAQQPVGGAATAGTTLTGLVRDSLARRPLRDAIVQLADADGTGRFVRSASSDSLGRYRFDDVPPGRYLLGFLHPVLDSIGIEPIVREVTIGTRPARADLSTPSPARLRQGICGDQPRAANVRDSGAVVIGFVRDGGSSLPAVGATVIAEWIEYAFTGGGFVRRQPNRTATVAENGWYALCDVPSPGIISLVAQRGADSTDRLDLQVPEQGFLRRDLFVAPAQADARAVRRLTGTVLAEADLQPIPNAEVRLSTGQRLRAGPDGKFSVPDARPGTRMIEVRAVGYYPERRAVDVVDGAPYLEVVLTGLRQVLDTVRVNATRMQSAHLAGFDERRRRGTGRFLTAADIQRRAPVATSDLFRSFGGVRFERGPMGETYIHVRSMRDEMCAPDVYVNGLYLGQVTAEAIDDIAKPREIAGIEVHTGVLVPAEYSRGMAGEGCGVLLIWTR